MLIDQYAKKNVQGLMQMPAHSIQASWRVTDGARTKTAMAVWDEFDQSLAALRLPAPVAENVR